jgi:hypothetical protein
MRVAKILVDEEVGRPLGARIADLQDSNALMSLKRRAECVTLVMGFHMMSFLQWSAQY